jgi:polyhydroxyalkanoate synthesis regulator phasin
MADREKSAVATPPLVVVSTIPAAGSPAVGGVVPTIPPKRSPGHRGADVKDTVAEMAAKAHEISLEAGSKMAAAMKDVIGAAAGLTGLVIESARDLLQYMVRRGQMTQEEADKLMREVEASHGKRKPAAPSAPAAKAARVESVHAAPPRHSPAPTAHVAKPAAKHVAAKKPAAKKPTMKPAAKKHAVKSSAKSKAKASGKSAKRR